MGKLVLAIDQGTSSTKTLVFDEAGQVVSRASEPLRTHYLPNGFVEQDPFEIVGNVKASLASCLGQLKAAGRSPQDIVSCGISNQRETFVVWDRSGQPLAPAVVWQCKRSVGVCEALKNDGLSETIKEKTGLLIDPYFSGTKLIWLYQHNEAIRKAVDSGEAFFGTVDTWLLYHFTAGAYYLTDYTNASRTLFFNLNTLTWDRELLKLFGLERLNLPDCQPSSSFFAATTFDGLFEKPLPVTALIGDSHAAAFGEGCFTPGTAKATLGTGCSILMNVGESRQSSTNGMVSTICWSTEETTCYALEGVIVSCGATLEWIKNELGLIDNVAELEQVARSVDSNEGVYIIPAFSGLGSPEWDMSRKASIHGLTFATDKRHIIRAAQESIPYQIADVVAAMEADCGQPLSRLMVDGGITANGFVTSFLSDQLGKPVESIGMPDISAFGAAGLSGLKSGVFRSIAHLKELNTNKVVTTPTSQPAMAGWYRGWRQYRKSSFKI